MVFLSPPHLPEELAANVFHLCVDHPRVAVVAFHLQQLLALGDHVVAEVAGLRRLVARLLAHDQLQFVLCSERAKR